MLVLEENYWGFVDKRAKYWGYSFPQKVIDLNRFRRFEYEDEQEHQQEHEYEEEDALAHKISKYPQNQRITFRVLAV